MDKHTSKSAISIAACAALFISLAAGTAYAGKGNKPDRPKGPKLGLQIVNLCTLDASDINAPVLNVSSTIEDDSDDNGIGGGIVMSRTAQAATKVRGNLFNPIGDPQDLVFDGAAWSTSIDLCAADPTVGSARAVTALVKVDVVNGDKTTTTFASRCDDPFLPGDDLDGDGTDDVDQSDISIGHLGISCPIP